MDCSVKTKPGYQVFSPSFVVVFIGGDREGFEECKNWHDLMKELVNAFEKWPRDMTMVGREAGTSWIWNSILSQDIKDENYDITLAMSSSHADPVLGHCPGWGYLNI